LIAIGAVMAAAAGWAVLRLVWRHGQGRAAGLVVLAYGLFAGVAGLEELEKRLVWHTQAMSRLAVEEGTELLAFLVLLAAVIGVRASGAPGLRAMIPDPGRLRALPAWLLLGLAAHSLVALLVVPVLPDLSHRGNPGVWYPSAVYGLLAGAAGWAAAQRSERRGAWAWLAVLLLVCSVGAVFDLVYLAPGIHLVLPRWSFHGAYATYVWLIPPILLLAAAALTRRRGRLVGIGVLFAAILALRLWLPDWRIDAVTPGLVAYLWSLVLLHPATALPRDAREPAAAGITAGPRPGAGSPAGT
jgi:hypothetical protein